MFGNVVSVLYLYVRCCDVGSCNSRKILALYGRTLVMHGFVHSSGKAVLTAPKP